MGSGSSKHKKMTVDGADLRLRALNMHDAGANKALYKEHYSSFQELQTSLRSGPSKQIIASKYFANILKALLAGDDLALAPGSTEETHQEGPWRQPPHLPPAEQMLAALRAVKPPAKLKKDFAKEVKQRKREEKAQKKREQEEEKRRKQEEEKKDAL